MQAFAGKCNETDAISGGKCKKALDSRDGICYTDCTCPGGSFFMRKIAGYREAIGIGIGADSQPKKPMLPK